VYLWRRAGERSWSVLTLRVKSLSLSIAKLCAFTRSQTPAFRPVRAKASRTLSRGVLTLSQRGSCGELLRYPRRLVSEVKRSLKLEGWKSETWQTWSGSIETHQLCAVWWIIWMLYVGW
jgi:hypothetical protein